MINITNCLITYDDDVTQYVDIIRGIAPCDTQFSQGNVLPFVALPRSTAKWSVTNFETLDDAWFVKPTSSEFFGFRYSNQPSPWMNDYGQFVVRLHRTGPIQYLKTETIDYGVRISRSYRPYMMEVKMTELCSERRCLLMRLTPTEYGAVIEIETPPGLNENLTMEILIYRFTGQIDTSDLKFINGETTRQARRTAHGFRHHFCAEIVTDSENITSPSSGMLSWKTNPKGSLIRMNIGTSYISRDQACFNRKLAQAPSSWNELMETNKERWNSVLKRVRIPKASQLYDKQNLYTTLYRGLLFPQDLSEIDPQGNRVHFSPYSTEKSSFPGRVATATGFWDAYRALYPMVDLVFPDFAAEIFEGWVNAMRESRGTVPEWPSPGNGDMMEGSMSDVSMAEAVVKGLIKKEDIADVYEGMKRNAFMPGKTRARKGLSEYLRIGFVPLKVSATLNYMLADASIAKVAALLGDEENARVLEKRALSWGRVFDNETLFFRPMWENLTFFHVSGTDEIWQKTWELGGYMEGGPWQYRFYVPHDPAGLRKAYANASNKPYDNMRMCRKLMETMTDSGEYYFTSMHEAREMQQNAWGQYAHNNQPVHHMLYMFSHAGCAIEGQLYIQHTLATAYGPFGFAGDEDNGEMSSWYILSALGLYALDPASGNYQIGAPVLFDEMSITFPSGNVLSVTKDPELPARVISVKNKEYRYPFADTVIWNGVKMSLLSPVTISYSSLLAGGHLHFVYDGENIPVPNSTHLCVHEHESFSLLLDQKNSPKFWMTASIGYYFSPLISFSVGNMIGCVLYASFVGRLGLKGILVGVAFGTVIYLLTMGINYLPKQYSRRTNTVSER